ncbi:MAG TPA: hypothetical protein VF006_06715 [Longimicrobium sp.]
MMRFLVALLTTFVLVACGTAPAARDRSHPRNVSLDPAVEFLLTSAATDFHTHRASYPARFRNVRSGYFVTVEGTRQYRLCGEFLPAQQGGEAEWTRFATITTDPYEQWLGGQTAPFCDSSVTWHRGDLSSLLQSRLDALR